LGHGATVIDADLSGRRSVGEISDGIRVLNVNRSNSIYAVARVGNIDVVELVDKYEDAFALRRNDLAELAARLVSEGGGLIFIDAPRPAGDAIRPLVKVTSRALIVMEPDMLGTSTARVTIRDLTKLGIPTKAMWLVVNARQGKAGIAARELEKIFGIPVVAEVPNQRDRRAYDKTIEALARKGLEAPAEAPFTNLTRALSASAASLDTSSPGSSPNNDRPVAPDNEAELARKAQTDRHNKIRQEINDAMVSRVDLVAASRGHSDGEKISKLRETIDTILAEILEGRTDIGELTLAERAQLKQEIIDEQLGLGPLEDLMRDPAVSEIMVNGPKRVYVERSGKLTLSSRTFKDDRHVRLVIERIVAPLGRRIDESSPMVDARLSDGSRVNAIIEPLSLKGSTLTIRRFGTKRLGIQDLVHFGSIPQDAVGFLKATVEGRLNVVVSGGTGTGKTTFLNILSNFIPEGERIVTIEDAAELQLNQDHVVSLEARPANIEGKGAIHIRDLVKNSLRMRPDRIVVGECRGGEALDMLQAMNTGHDGSLTTLHANTPRDALSRLETLVLMAGFDLPVKAIREQIASAVDVIVQIERMRDGSRKVVSITEVVGMEGDIVTIQEIVRYQARGLNDEGKVVGDFQYTGVQPHYMPRFEENGVHFDVRELAKLQQVAAAW